MLSLVFYTDVVYGMGEYENNEITMDCIKNKMSLLLGLGVLAMLLLGALGYKTYKLAKKYYITQQAHSQINYQINENVARLSSQVHQMYNINQEMLIEKLANHLKVYKTYDNDGELKLFRLGRDRDGGYVVAEKAVLSSDVLLGYGIADDASFEEHFSEKYQKPSYGFDCAMRSFESKNRLFTFVDQCIGNDKHLYNPDSSSKKVANYSEQLNNLKLVGKKVFIKMDIEGAEYAAFEDILRYSNDITGIALEVHLDNLESISKAITLLSRLERDFILVHIHNNNCCQTMLTAPNIIGGITVPLELSFINKSLVTESHLAKSQTSPQEIDFPNCPAEPEKLFELILPRDETTSNLNQNKL